MRPNYLFFFKTRFKNLITNSTVGSEFLIFIDEFGCLSRPRAQRSQSVGGAAEADINHASSMLLTFGATGRFGVRRQQEHPLQRPLVDGGPYIQVNNSPCPEGSTNNTPSITKGRKRKRVGNKEGKETTNIYLLSPLSLFHPFFSWFTIGFWKACGELIGSGGFEMEALVLVMEAAQNYIEYSTNSTSLNFNHTAWQNRLVSKDVPDSVKNCRVLGERSLTMHVWALLVEKRSFIRYLK